MGELTSWRRILRVWCAQVIYNGRRWSVERRYSEFDMLDKELQRMWAFDPTVRLGELPSKVSFKCGCEWESVRVGGCAGGVM